MSEQTTFSEAPASFTVKAISPNGYDVMLTLRDGDAGDLMPRAMKALEWLASNGFKPTGRASNGSNGGNGQADSQICPVHQVKMQKHSNERGSWFSHKAVNPDTGEEYWCKGQEK